MNSQTPESDPTLSKVLSAWKVTASPPPHFEQNVWSRIRRSDHPSLSPFQSLVEDLRLIFSHHRALAFSLVMGALLLGVGMGKLRADHSLESTRSELARNYIASIDPYHGERR